MEMMGGMLGGAFGAVGSIVGASIAADAQKYSANTNWSIALMNYYARERERYQAKIEAQRIEMKQDLGMTTARGDRTRFVPGVGWVQEPSASTAALMGREDAEKMAQFGDLASKRRLIQGNLAQQAKERDYSNALFDEMKNRTTPTAGELERLITGAQAPATSGAFDDAMAVGARQAMRTGTNPQGILSEIAKQQATAMGAIGSSAKTQALSLAPQLEDQEKKMQANLYNLFATRASAQPDVSFSPTPIDSGGLAAMAGRNNEAGLKAAMMEGGRLPFVPPNYGPANLAGAIGAAGQGFFRNMQGNRNLFGEGGGGNLWDVMSSDERNRGNTGSFAGVP